MVQLCASDVGTAPAGQPATAFDWAAAKMVASCGEMQVVTFYHVLGLCDCDMRHPFALRIATIPGPHLACDSLG